MSSNDTSEFRPMRNATHHFLHDLLPASLAERGFDRLLGFLLDEGRRRRCQLLRLPVLTVLAFRLRLLRDNISFYTKLQIQTRPSLPRYNAVTNISTYFQHFTVLCTLYVSLWYITYHKVMDFNH